MGLLVDLMPGAIAQAGAEDSRPIGRGRENLVEVPFTARAEGMVTIACSVALAHFYSVELGQAAAGGSVRAQFWADPASGEMLLLNALDDHMPVLSLWCGMAGRSWSSRAIITVERAAGRVPAPIEVRCAADGERLVCR